MTGEEGEGRRGKGVRRSVLYRRLAEEERGLCLDWLSTGDVTSSRPVKTTCLTLKATKTQTTKNLLNVLS